MVALVPATVVEVGQAEAEHIFCMAEAVVAVPPQAEAVDMATARTEAAAEAAVIPIPSSLSGQARESPGQSAQAVAQAVEPLAATGGLGSPGQNGDDSRCRQHRTFLTLGFLFRGVQRPLHSGLVWTGGPTGSRL